MTSILKLSKAVVVERSIVEKRKTEELTKTLAEIYSYQLPVKFVENLKQFFSNKNAAKCLEDQSLHEDLYLILENKSFTLTQEEMNVIKAYHELKTRILGGTIDTYDFATVPVGWSVDKNLSISKRSGNPHIISRKSASYSIGVKALSKIWNLASKYWSGHTKEDTLSSVPASGRYNFVRINKDHILIGCQRIERYELEQLAVYLEWDFPRMG
jgi:hypothetical protein